MWILGGGVRPGRLFLGALHAIGRAREQYSLSKRDRNHFLHPKRRSESPSPKVGIVRRLRARSATRYAADGHKADQALVSTILPNTCLVCVWAGQRPNGVLAWSRSSPRAGTQLARSSGYQKRPLSWPGPWGICGGAQGRHGLRAQLRGPRPVSPTPKMPCAGCSLPGAGPGGIWLGTAPAGSFRGS